MREAAQALGYRPNPVFTQMMRAVRHSGPVRARAILGILHGFSDSHPERSIPFHMEALEALPYQRIQEAHHLCYRLVTAHILEGEEEFIVEEVVAKVLADFRTFLAALPGGAG